MKANKFLIEIHKN